MQEAAYLNWIDFILKGVQIVFLNLVLSGDNVGIIALAVRDLSPRKAKWANLFGGTAAMILRVFFIAMLGFILSFRFLHLHLIGGILLLFVTYQMVRKGEGTVKNKKVGSNFFKAVFSIVIADLSMSFDNALAVASVVMAEGGRLDPPKLALVVIGLLACVPVIFWGGQAVSKLMGRFPIIIHFCAAILVYTSMVMVFEDDFFAVSSYSNTIGMILGIVSGVLTVIYGLVSRKKDIQECRP
ncbi:MAG TPA: hypothetical protein DEP42_03970 [Ruminococcaceae bacterium]|nr:hypothetical protein [Oscillospiraceae bacterium]